MSARKSFILKADEHKRISGDEYKSVKTPVKKSPIGVKTP